MKWLKKMGKLSALLSKRLGNKENYQGKIAELAQRSSEGSLSGFSGVFGVSELNEKERGGLVALLEKYAPPDREIQNDLRLLSSLTAEVKAITHQAVILHGERIKRAQELLKSYRDGAFSAWLVITYGNRQTPYNFLQYYSFYTALPERMRPYMEKMPRQAVYTLASREGSLEKKLQILLDAQGQTKEALVRTIRMAFPLSQKDGRRENVGENALGLLQRLTGSLKATEETFSPKLAARLAEQLKELLTVVEEKGQKV